MGDPDSMGIRGEKASKSVSSALESKSTITGENTTAKATVVHGSTAPTTPARIASDLPISDRDFLAAEQGHRPKNVLGGTLADCHKLLAEAPVGLNFFMNEAAPAPAPGRKAKKRRKIDMRKWQSRMRSTPWPRTSKP